jgi:uncharacterized membrane protein YuzA (DUF378 family)
METLQKVLLVITIIGAINWGMIGIFNINLVSLLFGEETFLTKLVYTLVGICGLISTGIILKPLDTHHA